jgi:hypothetical protein
LSPDPLFVSFVDPIRLRFCHATRHSPVHFSPMPAPVLGGLLARRHDPA